MIVDSHAVIEDSNILGGSGQGLPHFRRGPGKGPLLPLGPSLLALQKVLLQNE